jgi:EAL domain-containing protein (putative c-di-GMP-specific phosphodiesterase class I)
MAQQLNLTIVAEGVETSAELEYLKSRHCDHFQGYYFSRPVAFTLFSDQIARADRETLRE